MNIEKSDNSWKQKFFIFFLFFILTYIQTKYVWFYYDDYGYAKLYFKIGTDQFSNDINLTNIIGYLKWHYLHWGGRVVFIFFLILALQLGVSGFMLVNAVILAFILTVTFFIIKYYLYKRNLKSNNVVLFLTIAGVWLFLPRVTYVSSIFWGSAVSLYAWPLAFLLTGLKILQNVQEEKSFFKYILVCICFFMSGISHEFIGGMAIILLSILLIKEQKYRNTYIYIVLLFTILGYVFLLLAPGNFARRGDFGLMQMIENIPERTLYILQGIFISTYGIIFSICCFITIKYKYYKLAWLKNLYPLFIVILFPFSFFYVVWQTGRQMFFPSMFFLGLIFIIILTVFFSNSKKIYLYLFTSASIIVFYSTILYQYKENYNILVINDKNLQSCNNEIIFYKMPYPHHCEGMPYMSGKSYLEPLIRKYYNIDKNTKIIYKDYINNIE